MAGNLEVPTVLLHNCSFGLEAADDAQNVEIDTLADPQLQFRGGAQPPAPIWAPCNSMNPPDWIYKVFFYA